MNLISSVTEPDVTHHSSGSMLLRLAGLCSAVLFIGLLVTAALLKPDPTGLGTHHQLGLPPCSIRVLFGMRCPSCGMTTSWAYLTEGNLLAAAQANIGGLLLGLYSLGCIYLTSKITLTGRLPTDRVIRNYTIVLIGIAVVTFVDWLIKLSA